MFSVLCLYIESIFLRFQRLFTYGFLTCHNTHNETNKLTHNKEQSTPTVTVTENEGMNGETETDRGRQGT